MRANKKTATKKCFDEIFWMNNRETFFDRNTSDTDNMKIMCVP